MKIKSIDFRLENLELTKPYTIAWKTVDQVENLFCTIALENGAYGYGSCNPENEVVHVSTKQTLEAKDHLDLDLLLGHTVQNPEALIKRLYPALENVPTLLAALDIAIYDAWAKCLGKSLSQAWGVKQSPLSTSVTIGIMDVAQTLEEARAFIRLGFNHLKVKIGIDPVQDLERLTKLREAFGSSIVIRTDVNQGYTIDQFKKLYQDCTTLDIELYEQPIRADLFESVDILDEGLRKAIAADESLHGREDALLIAQKHRAGIFNIKLMKCGGLYAAQQMSQIAESNHIDLMWGCNDESRLSIAAAMHLAYTNANTKYLDLDGSFDLAKDPATGGFNVINGKLIPLDRPGLGIDYTSI